MTARSDTAQGTCLWPFLLLHLAVVPAIIRLMTQLLPSFKSLTDGFTGNAGPILEFAMIGSRGHAIARFMYEDTAFDTLLQVVVVEAIALVAYVASAWELCTFRHVRSGWGI